MKLKTQKSYQIQLKKFVLKATKMTINAFLLILLRYCKRWKRLDDTTKSQFFTFSLCLSQQVWLSTFLCKICKTQRVSLTKKI